ncbi:MAG: hypothetical protein HY898_29610 [Deltaproteobacteria bacterium]|nr:hypothetical protein [Deltaproteobacteria bacterium]
MSAADDKFDKKLDGWLTPWPVNERPQVAWDDMAERIGARIARVRRESALDEWFEPPGPSQPDEGSLAPARASGGPSMSEEADKPRSDEPAKAGQEEVDKPKSEEADKPRKSLKEIAKRVSIPPPPMAPDAGRTSSPSLPQPATGTPLPVTSRPVEAKESDSGVVNLQAVREQAASIPDMGVAPASTGLFDEDDEKKPAVQAAVARPAPKKSSMVPLFVGGVVALTAIAAVAVIGMRGGQKDMAAQNAPAAASAAPVQAPASTSSAAPVEVASAEAPAASGSASPASGPLARNDDNRPAAPGEARTGDKGVAAKAEDPKEKSPAAAPPSDPGNLQGAMDKAVGGSTPAKTAEPTAKTAPASGDIPEAPSQGAIQGALGAVMGAARACVAGMDEPSRAQITFGSDGHVQSVTVSGAASGKPAAGCIVAALKRAKVTPFQRSSFSVGVTIRP